MRTQLASVNMFEDLIPTPHPLRNGILQGLLIFVVVMAGFSLVIWIQRKYKVNFFIWAGILFAFLTVTSDGKLGFALVSAACFIVSEWKKQKERKS